LMRILILGLLVSAVFAAWECSRRSESLSAANAQCLLDNDESKFCEHDKSLRVSLCKLHGERTSPCKDELLKHEHTCGSVFQWGQQAVYGDHTGRKLLGGSCLGTGCGTNQGAPSGHSPLIGPRCSSSVAQFGSACTKYVFGYTALWAIFGYKQEVMKPGEADPLVADWLQCGSGCTELGVGTELHGGRCDVHLSGSHTCKQSYKVSGCTFQISVTYIIGIDELRDSTYKLSVSSRQVQWANDATSTCKTYAMA